MNNGDSLLIGADLSLAKRIVDAGGRYSHRGVLGDLLGIMADAGVRCARVRLFHDPSGHGAQVNDLAYTLDLVERLRDHGLSFFLAPHFSDGWADPGKQFPPRAWAGLPYDDLCAELRAYCRETMRAFAQRGLIPEIVQVGNEITPGMLWEHGRVAPSHGTSSVHWSQEELRAVGEERWARFAGLLRAAIAGIGEGLAPATTKLMLHIDRGGDWETCEWFFGNVERHHVRFDLIGLSYYPFWHGMPERLDQTCRRLLERFDKDLVLAETAYPYSDHEAYHNSLPEDPELLGRILAEYPISPEGQRRFVEDVVRIIDALPDGRGRGVFYWAPEWIPVAGQADEDDADTCWVRALFDREGRALPALDALVPSARVRPRMGKAGGVCSTATATDGA